MPVIAGPRWYRSRIRSIGPLLGVVPMILVGGVAYIVLQLSDSRWSGLAGLVGGVVAAPGLLVVGAPLGGDEWYPLAILASVPLWLLIGIVASRRATDRPVASWRDYWREVVWMSVAVATGAVGSLVAATQLLGEPLLL